MARDKYHLNVKCAANGCNERAHYYYDTKSEYSDGYKRHNGNYKCVRHSSPDRLLSSTNRMTSVEYTCVEKDGNHYWQGAGKAYLDSGFISGNGWKAFARDFPLGSKIVELTTIEIPD